MFRDSSSPRPRPLMAILKLTPGRSRIVQLLSVDWFCASTHWVGRGLLCAGAGECALCEMGAPRDRYWLPVRAVPQGDRYLVEFSGQASARLEQAVRFDSGRWAAGSLVELERRTRKSGLVATAAGWEKLPRDLSRNEWISCVLAVYGLPAIGEGEELEAYQERVQPRVASRAELARATLSNGCAG